MSTKAWQVSAGVLCLGVIALVVWAQSETRVSWNRKAAARYLDRREGEWIGWPAAARDHGTFCVSCHTAMPYALVRPALRAALGENTPATNESRLIDNVRKRVEFWRDEQPYYGDMATQSRGTEAVLNALILASHDAQRGQLTVDTLAAFDHMWETQDGASNMKGAWPWIQFDNEPWEAADSPFYGACLAAVAVGSAPEKYYSLSSIQGNLDLLRDYLKREAGAQSPMNRVNLLWASTKLPRLLSPAEQRAIADEIVSKQRADGGWSTSSMVGAWQRHDGTPLAKQSDGYATGLTVFVLEQLAGSRYDAHIKQGLTWLLQNQAMWGGQWTAYSLNRRRYDPFSNAARFMDDAATSYAVLALTQAGDRFGTNSEAAIRPKDIVNHPDSVDFVQRAKRIFVTGSRP